MRKILFWLSLFYWLPTAQAATLKLQAYPNARQVFYTAPHPEDYWLALGVYKKIEGRWQADKSQQLSGLLERTTFELPANNSADNGFSFFKKQLDEHKARELFYCKARDCGTSNSWANNHFKIIQLYGLDQYQFYGAYEITDATNKRFYVALYSVMRGNKRTYVQLDVLAQLDVLDVKTGT